MDAITLGKQLIEPGDLVVSTTDAPESTSGLLLSLWGGLLLTSFGKKGPFCCRLSKRRRRGLQCLFVEDLSLDPSREWEIYRLTPTEHLTDGEEQDLEAIVKRMMHAETWHDRSMNATVAIALILMRFGKLPRKRPDQYCASSLLSELVELMIYSHVSVLLDVEPVPAVLPFPHAA